ncbi:MAG: hypothetical protein O3A84_16475 [Proteobacteria bacterium]|nr:hypothetical protein [Pseudomonadota bacterium]
MSVEGHTTAVDIVLNTANGHFRLRIARQRDRPQDGECEGIRQSKRRAAAGIRRSNRLSSDVNARPIGNVRRWTVADETLTIFLADDYSDLLARILSNGTCITQQEHSDG